MNQTPEQLAVAQSDRSRILCVAAAGSGKTKTLVDRIHYLATIGVLPSHMAVVTFTNAAANELLERIGDEIKIGFCGTLHSLMIRLIRQSGHLSEFSVIDEEQAEALLVEHMERIHYKGTRKAVDAALEKEANRKPGTGFLAASDDAALVVASFRRALRADCLLTYDDVLKEGYEALVKWPPEKGFPFEALFVDEYQDSGPIDAMIYGAMVSPWQFVVGDPKQSIYGFRGGDIGNIKKLMRSDHFARYDLTKNFRCSYTVVEAANALTGDSSMQSGTNAIGKVEFVESLTGESEIFDVAKLLKQSPLESKAVLVRTNALVDEWATGLTNAGLSVRKRTKLALPTDWQHAKNALSFLRRPSNDRMAYKIIEFMHGASIAEKEKAAANKALTSINSRVFLVEHCSLARRALDSLPGLGVSADTVRALNLVVGKLQPGASIEDLQFAISQIEFSGEEVGEGITVTTMHAAKGREFDLVCLPALEESKRKGEDIEEERRLLYVGITRARNHVILSYAQSRRPKQWAIPKGGRKPKLMPHEPRNVSPFLKDIGVIE